MTERDQARAFAADVQNVLNRYRKEFELSLAAASGVLAIIQHEMIAQALEEEYEDEEES